MAADNPSKPIGTGTPEFSSARPSDFMRARRPEKFSDTTGPRRVLLGRDLLHFKLSTLTSLKQELDFENFARRLAEREICPNLVPQTGPTGGGDSKMDSLTYPVAEILADRWFRGAPKAPAEEFWAFAFSAKADWRSKVKSDIAKIAALTTRPKRIYFISSQLIPDKQRAGTETDLGKKHGIPVHILDRQWIVEKTIDNGHEVVAVESLHIDVPHLSAPRLGPRDAARSAELEMILDELRNPDTGTVADYFLAEQYLRAARLSRELERPRAETERLLIQARDLARRAGNTGQQLRAIYEQAWTAFWWFDSPSICNDLYPEAETLAIVAEDAGELELLGNLWTILYPHFRKGAFDAGSASSEARLLTLRKRLSELALDVRRPNNALHAEALDCTLSLISPAQEELPGILARMRGCLQRSAGLGLYPARQLIGLIMEMGDLIGDVPGYDKLVGDACAATASREGDVAKGELLLQRGFQLVNQGRHTDAIVVLSEARELLSKRESLIEAALTHLGCALSYERLGLLWAARREAALSFSQSMFLAKDGVVPLVAYRAASRLVWIELQIGRIPSVLAWGQVSGILARAFVAQKSPAPEFEDERRNQDLVLGILFLRASLAELAHLAGLPTKLAETGWPMSRIALLFALGHEDQVSSDCQGEMTDPAQRLALFEKWVSQPASSDLPDSLILHSGLRESYQTFLLGTRFRFDLDNTPATVLLAEELLAALEAFFATFDYRTTVFTASQLRFRVTESALNAFPPDSVRSGFNWTLRVSSQLRVELSSPAGQEAFRGFLRGIITEVVATASIIKTPSLLRSEIEKSGAVPRALFGTAANDSPTDSEGQLESWVAKPEYQLKRAERWLPVEPTLGPPDKITPGQGEVPAELRKPPRHRDFRLLSVIDVPTWNHAKWRATGVAAIVGSPFPPTLAIIFENIEAGRKIFENWRETFGAEDSENRIRVAVIEGTGDDGTAYSVTVGSNLDREIRDFPKPGGTGWVQFASISRYNEMHPGPGSQNLSTLKAQYERARSYVLAPAALVRDAANGFGFTPCLDVAITKREIVFRKAQDIGEHDQDRIVLPKGTPKAHPPDRRGDRGDSLKRAKKRARKASRGARKKARR